MNLSDINWDFNAAGTWPKPIKVVFIGLVGIIVLGAGFYFDTLEQIKVLEASEKKEHDLKNSFETKQRKAVNLEDYQDQLTQIEAELYEMIRQMPTKEEVASLLTDISQTGLASGLEFRLFKPGAAIRRDFYSELPINIEVIGRYEELGLFISGVASLPRIVTVHDVSILPMDKNGKAVTKTANTSDKDIKPGSMLMKAVVKTYNEGVAPAPDKDKNAKGAKGAKQLNKGKTK
ncbi:type 4a pilus biogenesis protein PilO [Methylocucumis oryzae]|uniref:Pilus assembly protein PilO n=1 Tax=Methylocucumis oryzae TaxID=1632867 RepID=A0A0F3ILC5_9GAMM|nr:type 4a pilus biogenesis protein PilO [Methylocucumis oryzae]KJV06379.1 pilus assembly protein PilO [Methylocucumis oryzae]